MTQIAVFVGSIRADSLNKKMAKNLEELAPEGVTFVYADIASLPLFNQDLEASAYPVEAQAIKDLVVASDGVLFVTPEYNRSVPGVLKNAIDWVSRPWGTNSFDGKPAGVVGASGSTLGTALAQAHLRNILIYLNTKVLGQPEVYFAGAHELFDEEGVVIDTSNEFLRKYINTFIEHVNS
ncbi:NAD(P)H-dependent oxidoreductase [Patescibacteria group bacterium]|nr:MAG: NAD(P)H-dependent oxidoreductase [Patescibacteria group bacterium]